MKHLLASRLVPVSAGLLWLTSCGVSDIQFRDFLVSTSIRTFFSTLGTALQAAIVSGSA